MLPIDNTSLLGNFSSMAGNNLSNSTVAAKAPAVKDNYFDQNSLNAVKTMGRHNDPAALKEISKKFEAMFVQQMLKSMRDANAVFAEGDMFSSEEVKFHQEMMDSQMVLNLTSGAGIGIAKSMYQQMQKLYGKPANSESIEVQPLQPSVSGIRPLKTSAVGIPEFIAKPGTKSSAAKSQEDFLEKMRPHAEKAAAELNVNADVLLAQAALETGWGQHLIHDGNGANTFNIFNIKATGWQGKSVAVNTLENRQGITQQERASFRQYDDYAQSFADYVSLIKNNPRYKHALAAGSDSEGYADALQKAGYATDPHYAQKIKRLINSDTIRAASDVSGGNTSGAQS
ncbi:MAG: flagellar assembly peptidoglycan hydrolase FlgJ [Gammaproteobacteria bacterium]|nr:MAG: flagellar assembly peptidoglycan hydrolase FlgJ [Gammaproteobacteria bacterium]